MSFSIPNPKRYITRLGIDTPFIQKREKNCQLSVALAIACDRGKEKSVHALAAIVRKLPLIDRVDIARRVAFQRERDISSKACDFEFNMAMGAKAEKDGNPALAWWFYGAAPKSSNAHAYRKRTERTENATAALLLYFDEKAYLSEIAKELSSPGTKSIPCTYSLN
ncbi:MAG: hypothetical protein WCT52_04895 [Candidatus Micrarchaeia archaeon]